MLIFQMCGRDVRSLVKATERPSGETEGLMLTRALAVNCLGLPASLPVIQRFSSPPALLKWTIFPAGVQERSPTPVPVPKVICLTALGVAAGANQIFETLTFCTVTSLVPLAVRLRL